LADLFGAIPASSFSGFTSKCLGSVPSASFVALVATQVANLKADAAAGFTQQQMLKVSAAGAAGFTQLQVAQFDATFGGGCSGTECFFLSFFTLLLTIHLLVFSNFVNFNALKCRNFCRFVHWNATGRLSRIYRQVCDSDSVQIVRRSRCHANWKLLAHLNQWIDAEPDDGHFGGWRGWIY
jgi:hypothetical protein